MPTPISLPTNYQRLDPFPLDVTSVFSTLSALTAYAATNPTAYPGQIIAVSGNDTGYIIKTDKTVTALGAGSFDGTTLKGVVSADGPFLIGSNTVPVTGNLLVIKGGNVRIDGVDLTTPGTTNYTPFSALSAFNTDGQSIFDLRGESVSANYNLSISNSGFPPSHFMKFFGGREGDPRPFIVVKTGTPLRLASYSDFWNRNNDFTEYMRIDTATGNVGIGTQTPGARLVVQGTISATQFVGPGISGGGGSGAYLPLSGGNVVGPVTINGTISGNNLSTSFNQGSATGSYSFAEGNGRAFGGYSHAEGSGDSLALGTPSHAEGHNTVARGSWGSHSEGVNTQANGDASHAEGSGCIAEGAASHAEGLQTLARGSSCHAEGSSTAAYGLNSHAEGFRTVTTTSNSHTEGIDSIASGSSSHAEGARTVVGVKVPFDTYTASTRTFTFLPSNSALMSTVAAGVPVALYANGQTKSFVAASRDTNTGAISSLSEVFTTDITSGTRFCVRQSSGDFSHAEGEDTNAAGTASHAEGDGASATGNASHAEGLNTIASGSNSHAEGQWTEAIGGDSHAEGWYTEAIGLQSHAEGQSTIAFGQASHAEGAGSHAVSNYGHAEGDSTLVGSNTTGGGKLGGHAEGFRTTVLGEYGHAEGYLTLVGEAIPFVLYAGGTDIMTFAPSVSAKTADLTPGTVTRFSYGGSLQKITVLSRDTSTGSISTNIVLPPFVNLGPGTVYTTGGAYGHAEGIDTAATGNNSHAEGSSTKALGSSSHAEGATTVAAGEASHSQGIFTTASGVACFAGGYGAVAAHNASYAWSDGNNITFGTSAYTTRTGQYMVSASGGVFIPGNLGIGTDDNNNALTVNGAISATGKITFNDLSSNVLINGGNIRGQNAAVGVRDSYNLSLRTNNLNQVWILSSGEVGIGISLANLLNHVSSTTPNQPKLTVSGSISASDSIRSNGNINAGSLTVPVSVIDLTADRDFVATDTNNIFHFDTTAGSLTAFFPANLPGGFNVAVMNTGTNKLHLSASPILKSLGSVLNDQYAGAFIYKSDASNTFAVGGV